MEQCSLLFDNGTVFITLILILFGFTLSYWQMLKSPVNKEIIIYMAPVILALAFMSIITKDISIHGSSTWAAMIYYLSVSTFVSGCYNTFFYIRREKVKAKDFFKNVFSPVAIRAGLYLISFSAALITAKNLALRIAPNPGYVTALLLTSPLFVMAFNKYNKIQDTASVKAGIFMIFFLIAMMILVNGKFGVID